MWGARDKVVWNAHRIYGLVQWPYLASNWKQETRYLGPQGPLTFSKVPYQRPGVVWQLLKRAGWVG